MTAVMKKTIVWMLLALSLVSCSSQNDQKEIKIATNAWIGYAPLFYAKEQGKLDGLGFTLIHNVSLAEAADIYSVGRADMVTTTQHEYYFLKNVTNDIVPVILLDRSNGGDMILSNKSVTELKKAKEIDAYLEVDSINAELLKEFMQKNGLKEEQMRFINKDQQKIQDVPYEPSRAIVIVTYSPYDVTLKEKGFKEVASTRDLESLVVIDALCARKEVATNQRSRLKRLKSIIDASIEEIKKDPKRSYEHVAKYLGNISYDEYLASLQLIEWINKPSKEILKRIEKLGYDEEYLIK